MSFRVAVLGEIVSHNDEMILSYSASGCYGIQVFDLSADQICSMLQNPEHSKGIDATKVGQDPVTKYGVYTGGRFYPTVSREEVVRVMEDVNVMLMTCTSTEHLSTYKIEMYDHLIADLLDQCKIVVLRVYAMNNNGQKSSTAEEILKYSHLSKAKSIKDKLFIVADDEVKLKMQSKSEIAHEPDLATVVSQLRALLLREEIKMAITDPIKETVSAGKALIDIGHSVSGWVTSLSKS